jgi:Protein of unknown function (DUF3306)
MSDERNLLSRWSERKAAVRRGEVPPEPADEAKTPPPDAQTAAIEPDQNLSAESAPADEDMPALPSIEELDFSSDYTVFLNAKVPEALRRAALRKLWASDPVLANLDGLNDYDEDYNLVDTTITAAQTAYRAGRGYFEEIEDKLETIDRVLGEDAGSGDESQKLSDSSESSGAGSISEDPVSENDAAGDNSADAPRQVAGAAPDINTSRSRKQSGE